MKAIPCVMVYGVGPKAVPLGEHTHVLIRAPGWSFPIALPVKGRYDGPGDKWDWDESTERPTLHPSILRTATGTDYRCHSFVGDGKVGFLPDCSHEYAGQTLDLLDVDEPEGAEC